MLNIVAKLARVYRWVTLQWLVQKMKTWHLIIFRMTRKFWRDISFKFRLRWSYAFTFSGKMNDNRQLVLHFVIKIKIWNYNVMPAGEELGTQGMEMTFYCQFLSKSPPWGKLLCQKSSKLWNYFGTISAVPVGEVVRYIRYDETKG